MTLAAQEHDRLRQVPLTDQARRVEELSTVNGPFVGKIGVTSHDVSGSLQVGTELPIVRQGAQIMYTVTGTEDLITQSPVVEKVHTLNPHGAADLAGWALSIMLVPDIAAGIRREPLPRIHALMDALDGARVDAGPAGYRFVVPGPAGTSSPAWIDEIPVNPAGSASH